MIRSRCSCDSPPWSAAASRPRPERRLREVVDLAAGPWRTRAPRWRPRGRGSGRGPPACRRGARHRRRGARARPRLRRAARSGRGRGPGARRCASASRAIGPAIVALNSAVWRCSGRAPRIRSRSSAKPMSSISSASSSTTVRDLVEAERAAIQVIDRASGRRDHDVHAAREPVELRRDRLAAVDGDDPHAELAAVLVDRLGDLHRELARGREHEGRRPAAAPVGRGAAAGDRLRRRPALVERRREPLEHRQRERRGLAGAGRRLGEQVAALEQRRDRGQLDGRGLLVAEGGQGAQQPLVELEGVEPAGFGGVFGHDTDASAG